MIAGRPGRQLRNQSIAKGLTGSQEAIDCLIAGRVKLDGYATNSVEKLRVITDSGLNELRNFQQIAKVAINDYIANQIGAYATKKI